MSRSTPQRRPYAPLEPWLCTAWRRSEEDIHHQGLHHGRGAWGRCAPASELPGGRATEYRLPRPAQQVRRSLQHLQHPGRVKKATQCYYLSYPCQDDDNLVDWDVVYKVLPCSKLPVPNDADYNIDPNTCQEDEFFQDNKLEGSFVIEMFGMEVDNVTVVDEDARDEVDNADDIQLLERLQLGSDEDEEDEVDNVLDDVDMADSDDERNDQVNPNDDYYF